MNIKKNMRKKYGNPIVWIMILLFMLCLSSCASGERSEETEQESRESTENRRHRTELEIEETTEDIYSVTPNTEGMEDFVPEYEWAGSWRSNDASYELWFSKWPSAWNELCGRQPEYVLKSPDGMETGFYMQAETSGQEVFGRFTAEFHGEAEPPYIILLEPDVVLYQDPDEDIYSRPVMDLENPSDEDIYSRSVTNLEAPADDDISRYIDFSIWDLGDGRTLHLLLNNFARLEDDVDAIECEYVWDTDSHSGQLYLEDEAYAMWLEDGVLHMESDYDVLSGWFVSFAFDRGDEEALELANSVWAYDGVEYYFHPDGSFGAYSAVDFEEGSYDWDGFSGSANIQDMRFLLWYSDGIFYIQGEDFENYELNYVGEID